MSAATLQRMAEQIAANVSGEGDEVAALRMGKHLRDFWTPDMLAELADCETIACINAATLAGSFAS